MTIKKYKQCDGCDERQQLEPIMHGGDFGWHWIEVSANATQYDTIFTHAHHFHNEECLFKFIEAKRNDKS